MQTSKKKPSVVFILLGAIFSAYLGYLIGGAWYEGIQFQEFMNRFNDVCAMPFRNYFNENTTTTIAISVGVYGMAIIMYYTSKRNFMPGK